MIVPGKVFNLLIFIYVCNHFREATLFPFNSLRYKDESDYALKFMESSWKEMQKEEARR